MGNRPTRGELGQALGLIGAGLLVRLAIVATTDNAVSSELEAYSRLNLMLQWLNNPGVYPQREFAPLHSFWLAALYLPFGRSVLAVRLGTILLSCLGLWALWDSVRRLADQRTALLALALLGAAYIPATVSTVSLAEGPALALFALALNFFIRADQGRGLNWGWLVASAVALNAAGAFRFEIWAFIPLLSLALWRRPGAAIAYAAMGAVFPAFHMAICWALEGDPLHSFRVAGDVALIQEAHKSLSQRLLGWPAAIERSVGWAIFLAMCAGMVSATAKRQIRLLAWLFGASLAVMIFRAATGRMAPDLLRYSTTLAALGCCLAAAALRPFLADDGPGKTIAIVISAFVLALGGYHTASSLDAQRLEIGLGPGPRAAAALIRANHGPDDLLLTSQAFHGYLAVESSLDISRVRFPECTGVPASEPWERQRECLAGDMAGKLRDLPVTYLAVDTSDDVVSALIERNSGAIIPEEGPVRLEVLLTQGTFTLYRVKRAER